jgi:hypothetical protein
VAKAKFAFVFYPVGLSATAVKEKKHFNSLPSLLRYGILRESGRGFSQNRR